MPVGFRGGMPENVRVLLVDLSKRFGGASVRALTLASNLEPWDAAIAGLKDSPVIKAAEEKKIPVKVVGQNRTDPLIPFRLMNIIHRERFQVMDTQNIQSKFWGSMAAYMSNVAFVSTLNSSYKDEHAGSWKGTVYSAIDRLTNHRADGYIAVSNSIRTELLRTGVSDDEVDLVTNAVNIEVSDFSRDRASVRSQIGVPEDCVLCISVGRLVWAKGYDIFIEAFARVAEVMPQVRAVILGDGELYDSLLRQVQEHGLENKIKLPGYCDRNTVLSVLGAADIFVMTSRSEGVPFAILEAAASGLPILATNCGGIPEILTDREDAILVPTEDPSSVSAGLIEMVNNKDLMKEMGANAAKNIKQNFSLDAQLRATRLAYLKALKRRQIHPSKMFQQN